MSLLLRIIQGPHSRYFYFTFFLLRRGQKKSLKWKKKTLVRKLLKLWLIGFQPRGQDSCNGFMDESERAGLADAR